MRKEMPLPAMHKGELHVGAIRQASLQLNKPKSTWCTYVISSYVEDVRNI